MTCDAGRSRVVLFSGGKISGEAANVALAGHLGMGWCRLGPSRRHRSGGAAGVPSLLPSQGGVLLLGELASVQRQATPGNGMGINGYRSPTQVRLRASAMRWRRTASSPSSSAVMRLGLPRVNDTWAWYDETWRQIQDIGPSPRAGHAMANVTSNDGDQITLFGGEGTNAFGDTWRLEDRS